MSSAFKILILAAALVAGVRAENPPAQTSTQNSRRISLDATDDKTETAAPEKKSLREQLVERFTKRDGRPASIVIFSAMETTATKMGGEISKAIESAMRTYGRLDIRRESYALPAMTMEDIRLAMARFGADVLVAPIVKDGTVDVFLFDKRFPYNLYSHSEAIPPEMEQAEPVAAAREMTRLLLRRLLFRYLNDQFFELPREESLPVLQSEIPAWVASQDSLNLVNRELTNRFYLSASLGAAVNMARSGQLWNSNLIGLQLGVRLYDRLFLEGQISAFSYNAFVGSLRYTFLNRNSPFRVNVGLGFSFVTRDKVWNQDQTIGLGRYSYYFVPSVSLLFPIGEVYIKTELQWFVSPSFNQFIWTFMPGVQVHF